MCRYEHHAYFETIWNHSCGLFYLTAKGFIPVDSFKQILRELDGAVPEEELDDIVDEIDADGSGTVDFEGTAILLNSNWPVLTNYFLLFTEFMEVMTGE